MVAIVASKVNKCFYWTESNGEFLREELNDAKLADALMEDYRTAPVDPAMKQLLSFAEKVARDPSQVTPNDIAKLRSEGLSDRAILDATHVAGFFSYMNRVVKALGADGGSLSSEKTVRNIASLSDARQRLWEEIATRGQHFCHLGWTRIPQLKWEVMRKEQTFRSEDNAFCLWAGGGCQCAA
jgi:hypothetical protein